MKKLLPIGTVVSLIDGNKKLMITGYSSKNPENGQIYDYNACIFPEGIMEDVYSLFNQSDIEEIFYKGLENEEQEAFFEKMDSMLTPGTSGNALKNDQDNSKKTESGNIKKYRTPQEPTRPMSSTEMIKKYGVAHSSMDNFMKGK